MLSALGKEDADVEKRRWVRVSISSESLAKTTSGKYEVTYNPIPKESKLVGCYWDCDLAIITLLMENEKFAPIPSGSPIPFHGPITIRRIDDDI